MYSAAVMLDGGRACEDSEMNEQAKSQRGLLMELFLCMIYGVVFDVSRWVHCSSQSLHSCMQCECRELMLLVLLVWMGREAVEKRPDPVWCKNNSVDNGHARMRIVMVFLFILSGTCRAQ